MNLELIRQFVTGKPEIIAPGSFANQHIRSTGYTTTNLEVVIIGLPDNENENSFIVSDQIKDQLFRLSPLSRKVSVLDFGNIIPGKNLSETSGRLSKLVVELFKGNLKVFITGNCRLYLKQLSLAFLENEIPLNQVWIDSEINFDQFVYDPLSLNLSETTANSHYNYTNLGYQSYFVEKETIDFINETNFEAYRLGLIRSKIQEFEPILRDANFLNISLNSIKFCDSPGSINASPNGFNGDEVCQLAFYSGYSTSLQLFSLFDFLPSEDKRCISAKLAAQIIWHAMEGIALKLPEDPLTNPENFEKFHIHIDAAGQNLAFYKSNLTSRWWMEIDHEKARHIITLSCTQSDYETACKQEIPERLWRLIKRLKF